MDLRVLRYFVTLADTLHFGRAAAALSMSQPPLSRQIRAFEDELGVELFLREPRGVRLTPAGSALLPQARRLLREADALTAGARELAHGEVGVVRLGFISTAAHNVLPRVLPAFRHARPGIRLTLVEATTDAQLTGLRDDTLDAGLVVPPVPVPLRCEVLLREPLIAALPRTDVLPSRSRQGRVAAHGGGGTRTSERSFAARHRWPRRLPLETLADEPFILFPRRAAPGLYDLIIGLCARAGFVPRIEQEAIQMPTIVSLVGAGMGVALVPASLARVRQTDVVYRPLAEPGPPMEVGLAWNDATPTPAVAAFVAHVRGVFIPGKR
jgi:DNA-binding transcriptional LysR family regulator